MELIKDAKKLNSEIGRIKTAGAKLDTAIWVAACSAMAHTSEHNNPAMLDNLVNAMAAGQRKKALVEYILEYAQVRLLSAKDKDDKLAIAKGRVFQLDKTKTLDLDGAMQEPWYEKRKHENDISDAYDAQKAVAGLLARIQKAAKAGAIKNQDAALADARALIIALGGKE